MDPYVVTAVLWLHDGDAAWHFLTLPEDVSDEIDARTAGRRTGFGSIRVEVAVGLTTWRTSLFPDTARGAYVLPVRKDVRHREGLRAGDHVRVTLRLVAN